MGTTDNFDVPAKGSFALADQIPIKDSVTGRGAYALGSEILVGLATAVQVTAGVTVLALTAVAHGNRTVAIASTSPIAITLPAATGTGASYKLVFTAAATATQHTIKVANTADAMMGLIASLTTTAGVMIGFKSTTTDDTITLNGTTTGGGIGAVYEIQDLATAKFLVRGADTAAMTTTPYSATV